MYIKLIWRKQERNLKVVLTQTTGNLQIIWVFKRNTEKTDSKYIATIKTWIC